MRAKKTTRKIVRAKARKQEASAPVDEAPLPSMPSVPLVSSPHAILDEAVAVAARTIANAAEGVEISREQLSAAQDILNRKGITSGGQRSNAIPEDYARASLAYVFRLLGFGEIKWPQTLVATLTAKDDALVSADDFNAALQDV